jgi:hypothetical protein
MDMKCTSCSYAWDYKPRNGVKRKYIVCPVCRANLKNPEWENKNVNSNNLESVKELIRPILLKYHVKKAAIFGSFARNEQREGSDLDLLVEFDYDKMDGLDYFRLWDELQKTLNLKVDLVSFQYLNPLIKNEVHKEEIAVL